VIELCPYCCAQHDGLCPRISAIDYADDGATPKRVEFFHQEPEPQWRPPETDQHYRERMEPIVRGTCNEERTAKAIGLELDAIGEWYDMKRYGV
jgi:hypothetical protein